MAAGNNIKGITIEISGDTQPLQNALKDVNKESKKVSDELKQVENLLKFDPGNVALVAQKTQLLTDAVAATTTKLDALKQAQAQVEQQFANGDIGEEQYRAFQRELVATENALKGYEAKLSSMQSEQDRFGQNQRDLQTFLNATGQSVDDLANTLGTRLTNAIRDGSASADQLDQALNRIGRAAVANGQDLDTFRNALRQVDNGANLDEIRQDLDRIGQAANEAEGEVKGFGSELASVVGGLVAGGGIAGAVTAAIGDADLKAVIDVTFDVPEESKASVLDAVKGVQAYGVDAEQALEGVRRQWALNGDASDESNAKVVKHAGVISKAYADIDFQELIQEANEIGGVLEISTEEALAMTNALLKAGFDPNQLDIISEYGNQLKMAGFNAQEIQAIMASGVDTKTWNIDNLLDGIKEGRIVGAEFGAEIDDATKGILKSAGLSSEKFQQLGKDIASGGEEGGAAMQELAKMLASVEDDTIRNQLGTKMYGTLWEEQGTKIVDTLMNMDDHMMTSAENTKLMDEAVKGIDSSPMVQIQQAAQDVTIALGPVFEKIAEIVVKIAEWIANNPQLTAVIVAITTAVGILTGIFAALMPAIGAIISVWPVLAAAFSAAAAPIAIAIGAITAVVAAGIALYQNWETVSAFLVTIWETIKTTATTVFQAVVDFITGAWTAIESVTAQVWSTLTESLSVLWDGILTMLTTVWDAIKLAAETVWGAIQLYFETILNVYTTIFTTAWDAIKTAVTTVWDAIKTSATTIFDTISKYLSDVWETVKTTFTNATTNIFNTVKTKFNEIQTNVQNIMNAVKKFLSDTWEAIKSTITTVVTNIFNTIRDKFNEIKTTINNIMNEVKKFLSDTWDAIKNSITTIVTNIFNTVRDKFNEIKTTITNTMNEVKKFISDTWETIKTTIYNAVTAIYNTVRDKFNELKNAVSNGMESAKKAITDTWETIESFFRNINLYDIGVSIMTGLFDGITSMATSLFNKAAEIANSIKDTIAGALDINSPSRVMIGFGKNIGEGLEIGMDNMVDRVAASSMRLADAASSVQASMASSTNASRAISAANYNTSSISTDNSRNFNSTIHITTAEDPTRAAERMIKRLAYQL